MGDLMPGWSDLVAQLGVAVPLVAILLYLLKQTTDERRAITADFLQTLRETVAANAAGNERVAASLNELALADRERKLEATAEHERMIRELDRIGSELARVAHLLSDKNGSTRRRSGGATA